MSTIPPDITWADAVFDGMMISRAAVYKRTGALDGLGNTIQTYVRVNVQLMDDTVQDFVACAVRNLKGEELNTPPAPVAETSHGIQQFLIFMRPITVDSPAIKLNIRHWLQILSPADLANNLDFVDPNDPNASAVMYNIYNISDPLMMGHHLEVAATVITP